MSRFAPLLLATALAACAVPNVRPQVNAVAPAALGLTGAPAPQVAERWWTALGDPQLDRVMDDALAGSPTLDQALARLRVAEADITRSGAGFRPQLGLNVQEQRTRLSEKYIIPPPYGGTDRWVGNALGEFSWTLDFWGRQAATVARARGTARAAGLDAAAARLALTGSVAQAYVELVRAERLQALADAFVASREQNLRLVNSRIRNQLASNFDARTAEALLVEAQQLRVRADGARDVAVHALAALAGHGADYYAGVGPARLDLAAALPLPATLPADLLGRRPDLLAARARIDAAASGREVARTAFFPNVNLVGNAGFQAIGLGALATGGAFTWAVGPALSLPIFDGGRRRGDYAGATAELDLATADYNDLVLRAVRDAADGVSAVRTTERDLAAQARLVGTLQDVVRLDERRTGAGLGSQLDILASGARLLDARQAATNIAADGLIRRVQLLVALGGGFQPTNLAEAAR